MPSVFLNCLTLFTTTNFLKQTTTPFATAADMTSMIIALHRVKDIAMFLVLIQLIQFESFKSNPLRFSSMKCHPTVPKQIRRRVGSSQKCFKRQCCQSNIVSTASSNGDSKRRLFKPFKKWSLLEFFLQNSDNFSKFTSILLEKLCFVRVSRKIYWYLERKADRRKYK